MADYITWKELLPRLLQKHSIFVYSKHTGKQKHRFFPYNKTSAPSQTEIMYFRRELVSNRRYSAATTQVYVSILNAFENGRKKVVAV